MTYRLDGKVAIVTGAAQGVGEACARIMAEQGATVVLGDLNGPGAEDAAEAIRAQGGQATGMAMDAREEASIRELIERTHRTHGRLDILHNNAGGAYEEPEALVADMSDEAWNATMDLNLTSGLWGVRHAVPLMVEQGGGAIVNTLSGAAYSGMSHRAAYGVAKAGLGTLTLYVAVQYGRQGIRCNAIALGMILSPRSFTVLSDSMRATLADQLTTPRAGTPDDVGYVAAFLASDAAGYLNGQVIRLDGGASIRLPFGGKRDEVAETAAGSPA